MKKRKISGGTRSELGRHCRDTFVWKDYFWALCLTKGDEAPIMVGVAALKGQ